MNNLFSIVIPTFNRAYCINKTIESVQQQTYPNWELLIIDDGSTDNTKEVIKKIKDLKVKYYKTKHGNACMARNTGLENAKGDFITYLDSDDYLYPEFLETVLDFFTKNPEKVFAVARHDRMIELLDKNQKIVDSISSIVPEKEKLTLKDFYRWKVKTTSSGLTHKNIIKKDNLRWDPKIKRFQDWDFLMQLGNKYPKEFLYIPKVLFKYNQRYGGDSMCSLASYLDWAKAFEAIYQKHKNDPLMKGQDWYPARVEKYRKLQKEFEEGKAIPPEYRYFPKVYKP